MRSSTERGVKQFSLSTFPAMLPPKSKDPLHGVTLETILTRLVEHYGWEELGRAVEIRCFNFDPSVKSSLVFLRKTPWARKKVEDLYVGIAAKWNPSSE